MTEPTPNAGTSPTPPASSAPDILDGSPPAPAAGSTPPAGSAPPAGATPAEKTWIDSLPEEMRGEASLKLHKDIGSLAKSYLHQQKMVGADKIAVPGKNASPDDWKQVYSKLGLPESIDKYEIKAEGANPELLGKFKQVAHEAGILPAQAEKILSLYAEVNKNASEALQTQQTAKIQEGVTKLREEWGQGWDNEVAAAKAAKTTYGDENFDKFLTENNLRSHPEMIKFLNRVGKSLGEDAIKGQGGGLGGQTPADAIAKIESIRGDMSGPYWNSEHPNHKSAVAEVSKLYSQAYPDKTG